jgi:transposase-like protein
MTDTANENHSGTAPPASPRKAAAGRQRATRRTLTSDQKADVARLYSETATPLPEIRRRFGIGDSSLYRILQQSGVALRGRAAADATPSPAASRPAADNKVQPARTPATTARKPRSSTTVSAPTTNSRSTAPGIRFRVSFVGVETISAVDINDAIRRADALGASEILDVQLVS